MNAFSKNLNLLRRMRRNRSTSAVRALVQETHLYREDFIQPLFVHAGSGGAEPIDSMPGVLRHSLSSLVEECRLLVDRGITAVAIFPCINPSDKEPMGRHALSSKNILYTALRAIKSDCPDLALIADVALDPYTSHGHDGLLDDQGGVENDTTVEVLMQLAVAEAEAGADIVAPSDMMDGRVRAIRYALDTASLENTGILAYSAKYASAYYGPFREAVGSSSEKSPSDSLSKKRMLDKRGYQMNPANIREALLEVRLDEEEGADMVMVKPAGAYLDVIRAVREATLLPVAAYQVSGEYAQICAAARLGWLDYKTTRNESLMAIKRAGATMILSYFAGEVVGELALT